MYRSLTLLALPLLVVGCHSSPAPTTTIDSFRDSYFGQQPSAASQVAGLPASAADQASAAPKANFAENKSTQTASAPLKQASPPPYKETIAAYIKRYAVNSNSLRLSKIGTPFQGSVNGQKGSVVCVELAGMSSKRTAYLLQDNTVVDSEFGAPACRDKQLVPWDNLGT